MATYLFSENRELKNIQDGDVVWDCGRRAQFKVDMLYIACLNNAKISFVSEHTMQGVEIYTAHFTRIQADTEPQSAPNTPVPMGSN